MNRRNKILLLFGLFVVGSIVSYFFSWNYLSNILIVYTLPVALNVYWLKRTKVKLFVFSLITVFLFAIPVELLCRLTDSWDVQSNLPRLFGLVPLENIIYAFINFFWVLAFYEYFVDREKKPRFGRKWPWLIGLYGLFFVLVMGSFALSGGELPGMQYWLIGIIGLLIPSLVIYGRNPKLLKKTILPTIFFAAVFLVHELVSLKLGHWWWPGEYLWPIQIFGGTFPLDDVLIWYFLSTPALIGGYEFFADDYS